MKVNQLLLQSRQKRLLGSVSSRRTKSVQLMAPLKGWRKTKRLQITTEGAKLELTQWSLLLMLSAWQAQVLMLL